MKSKYFVLVVLLAAPPASAQDNAPPKASKAEVQKVIDGIKADPKKMSQYCVLANLQSQLEAFGDKADDKKAEAIEKQMDEAAKSLGPEFEKLSTEQVDKDSAALLDGLAETCK